MVHNPLPVCTFPLPAPWNYCIKCHVALFLQLLLFITYTIQEIPTGPLHSLKVINITSHGHTWNPERFLRVVSLCPINWQNLWTLFPSFLPSFAFHSTHVASLKCATCGFVVKGPMTWIEAWSNRQGSSPGRHMLDTGFDLCPKLIGKRFLYFSQKGYTYHASERVLNISLSLPQKNLGSFCCISGITYCKWLHKPCILSLKKPSRVLLLFDLNFSSSVSMLCRWGTGHSVHQPSRLGFSRILSPFHWALPCHTTVFPVLFLLAPRAFLASDSSTSSQKPLGLYQ